MSSPREQLSHLAGQLTTVEQQEGLTDVELKQGLMGHILGCIATMGTIEKESERPVHDFVFQAAVNHVFERNAKILRGENIIESFPTKWIHQHFSENGDLTNWLPLHWCAVLSDETETITVSHLKKLLEEDPSLRLTSEEQEVSPTSLAIAKLNPSHTFVNELIVIDPDVVKVPDRDGAMALMYAGAWNEDTALLEKIYSLNPKAVNCTDAYGFLPLHFASYAGTVESVSYLLSKYPKAARVKNRAGVLPLLASSANARHGGVEMARVLLEEYPDAISIPDDEGSLPLHIAAQFSSFDLIRFLYAVNPVAASTANSEGLLPMHFAGLRKVKNIDIVDFLAEANTDAEAAKFVPVPTAGKEECIIS